MTTIVVLFNLKPETVLEDYENWAKTVDIPNVRKLPGVSGFHVLSARGLLNGDPKVPYSHVELIEVNDMEAFRAAVGTPEMKAVAAQFQAYALSPVFIVTEPLA